MRGAFILFEGVDRCGKTTQARRLVGALNDAGKAAVFMNFPDRATAIGRQISAYLSSAEELDDRAVHLLFSANRWEKRCVRRRSGLHARARGASSPLPQRSSRPPAAPTPPARSSSRRSARARTS